MSTYEDEHNLTNHDGGSPSNPGESQTARNGQRHLTLTQALDHFLNTPAYSSSAVPLTMDNLSTSRIPIEPQMVEMLQSMLQSSSDGVFTLSQDGKETKGVDDSFLDTLGRVPVKQLKNDDTCPICTNEYKSDSHPLVVELPCNSNHRFDLECIGPWLKLNRTCPLCRTDVTVKKVKDIPVDSEEEEEGWDMYG